MELSSLSGVKLEEVCRVCLESGNPVQSIFDALFLDDSDRTPVFIHETIMTVSEMKMVPGDGLPDSICTNCLETTRTVFEFQQKCNVSQATLNEFLLQINIHEETDTVQAEALDLKAASMTSACDEGKAENDEPDLCSKNDNYLNNEDADRGGSDADDSTAKFDYNVKIDQTTGAKIFGCKMCRRIYKFKRSLMTHMKTHSENGGYKCEVCDKEFKMCQSLTNHVKRHNGSRAYSCKVCGKRYRQSGSLTVHMRVHTGHRPFLCSICGKGFRQGADLGYHMRTHTKEKAYMCNVCGKTMTMQSHLVQHMRTHTGEKPYKCQDCNKAFLSNSRLKRHAIIHTGLKPHNCDVCGKSFNRISTLRVHSKIHTDERRHVCRVCGARFIQAHSLREHVLTHCSTGAV